VRVASGGGRCVVVRVLCERERERRDRGASEVLLSEEGHSSHFTNNTKLWPYCLRTVWPHNKAIFFHTAKPSSAQQRKQSQTNLNGRKIQDRCID
jgi:hypothetical protein